MIDSFLEPNMVKKKKKKRKKERKNEMNENDDNVIHPFSLKFAK